jgi:osmotically-inducible protein OsmY
LYPGPVTTRAGRQAVTTTKTKSDADIQRSVSQELEWDPRVDSTGILVQVKEGVVTLTGSVESYAKKVAARDAAHRIDGVLDVADELQVRLPGTPRTDQELAQAVRQTLTWDVYVPDTRIRSTVSDGWVTLEGDVDRWHQREDAVRAVERLNGVRGVTNRIVVKPQAVDPVKIRAAIESALARRAEREAKGIRVAVTGATVKLSGTVHSWAEKNAIERLARYSPGVLRIENEVVVDSYA